MRVMWALLVVLLFSGTALAMEEEELKQEQERLEKEIATCGEYPETPGCTAQVDSLPKNKRLVCLSETVNIFEKQDKYALCVTQAKIDSANHRDLDDEGNQMLEKLISLKNQLDERLGSQVYDDCRSDLDKCQLWRSNL